MIQSYLYTRANSLQKKHSQGMPGFTIVELLIVVVVIAILAAIILVSYNGIVNRAKESSAQSELSQTRDKLLVELSTTGTLPNNLQEAGVQSDSVDYSVSPDGKSYCINVADGSVRYFISSDKSNATKGTCHGSDGIAFNCAATPNACGYPDETNTGIVAGTVLLNVPAQTSSGTGWAYRSDINAIYTTANNAVISNLNTSGFIMVNHSNVTIRNVKLASGHHFPVECNYYNNNIGCQNLLVENFELSGTCTYGLSGANYTVRKSFLHACDNTFATSTNIVIEDNYIRGDSPGQGGGISAWGGTDVTIRRNTFKLAASNADFLVVGGTNEDLTIENNFINARPPIFVYPGTVNGIVMRNNRFNLIGSGSIAYLPGGSWTGNYHDQTGEYIEEND